MRSSHCSMVFILDGCSFHYAHTWSKSGISICWRHLVTSKESTNPIFFFGKRPCFHHSCATWNEQPSNIKTMHCREFKFGLIIVGDWKVNLSWPGLDLGANAVLHRWQEVLAVTEKSRFAAQFRIRLNWSGSNQYLIRVHFLFIYNKQKSELNIKQSGGEGL